MLSVDNLPRFVKMYDQNVQIEFFELETKLARLRDDDPFLRNIIPSSDNVLFLQFMGGNTTAIMSLQNFFYVFDSYSRDERGLNIPNGRSVLLKFRYIFKLRSVYRQHIQNLEINNRCISKHNLLDSEQKLLTCYPFFLNTRTVSGVKIT